MALFEDEGETVEKKRKRKDGRAVELNSKLKRNSSNHKASVDSFLGEGNEEISRLDPDVEPLERVKRGSRPTTAEAPVSKEVQRVEDWKEARKQFMSSKADKVLGISAEKSTTHKRKRLLKMGSADSAGHEMLSKEEFEKVKREVQLFGELFV